MAFQTINVSYSVKFDSIIYPILHHELTEGLQKIGFELSPGFPQRVPITARVSGQGEVARKGKTIIIINSDAQQLLISDESVGSAMSNFNDIQQMFIEEYGTDISEITKCFSFVGDFIYYTDKTTFSTISTKFASPIVDEISRIMGHDMGTFQINTAIKGLTVNSENWYDMIIRPSYERDDAYIIRVVIRNPDREVMRARARRGIALIADFPGGASPLKT